jgi:hypothetical protein
LISATPRATDCTAPRPMCFHRQCELVCRNHAHLWEPVISTAKTVVFPGASALGRLAAGRNRSAARVRI